jgi:hypothetical protein
MIIRFFIISLVYLYWFWVLTFAIFWVGFWRRDGYGIVEMDKLRVVFKV